ncbi:hypothetical protein PMAYCL1PPCAC_19220, partial [Pristionchus mayeri]
QELSIYKYILFVFILNDIIYTIIHFITHPVISISGEVFYLLSANYSERWIVCIFGTSHSHSFLILGFHFVYRYIAVVRHNGLHLFRQRWFIAILVSIFIAETILWFLFVYFLFSTDVDTCLDLSEVLKPYPENVADSIMSAHYWFSVPVIVIYSSVSTYKALHNNLSKRQRGIALQRQLYNTLLVQLLVPFLVMNVPVVFAVLPPLIHIRFTFPSNLMPKMFSIYPSQDALVILFGVHDYR